MFFLYFTESEFISADVDYNPWALDNALRLRLSEEMYHSFQYTQMPKEYLMFTTVCQKHDN